MNTDIKPGQEVRAVRDTQSAFSSDIYTGTYCVVKDPNYDAGRYSVAEAGYTMSVYLLGDDPANTLIVKPEDFEPATPAQLDPALVKAGDTVTVHVAADPPWTVSGEVTGGLGGSLFVGPVKVSTNGRWHDSATLTAHQPAPEPEPEWKPGTVWADQEGERYWFTNDGSADGATFRNDVGDEYAPSEMGDVRPLVVINPATVDVDALIVAANRGFGGVARVNDATANNIVRYVLAELGIEAS